MKPWLLLGAALALLASPVSAQSRWRGVAGAQYRYWAFSDENDLRDVLTYYATRSFHVQLEYWDFVDDDTDDQFRPEVGLHFRDERRSVYTVGWRHERQQERFWLGTDQMLPGPFVGRAEVSPIFASDGTFWVVAVGLDGYWGDYNFASATVVRDPREGETFWVFPLRVRLANQRNDWVQATFVPATGRTNGWALDVKYRWARFGVERNSRYDFTNVDNFITTIGVEVPIPRQE